MNQYIITPIKKRFGAIWVTKHQVDTQLAAWKFFFILGFGRSGTAFMANLLNQAPEAQVFHEPVIEDFLAHRQAHYNPQAAEKYIKGFRRKEIYLRLRHLPTGIYGETNGNLRCHANAIRGAFPNATLIHMVRDGRDVVRSHMSRRTMTLKNPFSMSMHPMEGDRWREHWIELDRFARICWYWQEENRRLRMAIERTIKFEKIISNYDYFSDKVLKPCGIQITEKDWNIAVATPRNTTAEFSMPKWDGWTMPQKNTFREICGEEMEKCGYEL